MGIIDRLRAMFGATQGERDKEQAEEKELAVERVEHDVEHEREAAAERIVEGPSSLDEHR